MAKYKLIFLYILFAIIIPSKALLAQNVTPDTADTEIDTTVKSELDIKYDSVLSKAALSLSASAYNDAIAFYKLASTLKPANVYPYKMIIYAEDLAFKQKRADDLKRKAKIRDDLSKANNEIDKKSWDSAKFFFNEVLSLNPQKTDQDYAKSKIEAIDLELARIAARIPPKPAPVVVVVPKNRREARAMRKMAERNAKLPPALTASASQVQTQIATQAANTAAPSATEVVQQKPAADTLRKQIAVAAPVTNQTIQKPTETSVPQNTVTAAPATNKTVQKPTENSVLQKTISAAPTADQAGQKPAETLISQKTEVAVPATNQTVQKPTETPAPQKTVAAALSTNQMAQKPTETPAPQKTIAATPVTNQTAQKPTQVSVPQKIVTAAPAVKDTQPGRAETALPQAAAGTTSPLSEGLSSSPAMSSAMNLVDSIDYIKLICQDISFIGSNAYIKVLIQNYSTTSSFLTDTLQVSLKKNNGALKKLDQRFISSFPVITPLGESIFVSFADASVGVDPDDIFILEMRDKTKKTKLALQIPWAVYKQQKNL